MRKLLLLRISQIYYRRIIFTTWQYYNQYDYKCFNSHLIKIKNYVQQSEVVSLIKRGSFIDLTSCAN